MPARLDWLTDDALLAALALGETDAAAVFVRRFQRRVFGLALMITADEALAEDAAQQAFEKAWRHAGSYDARRGSVATWLLAIARHVAIDSVRVRRSMPVDPAIVNDMLAPSSAPDPESAAVDGDQLDRLRQELVALPTEQRRAVVLATIGGFTSTEIATLEGVPVPTAKTRLRTGLRKLRAASEAER